MASDFSNVLRLTLNSLITMRLQMMKNLQDLCPQSKKTARCFFCLKIKTLICNRSKEHQRKQEALLALTPSIAPNSCIFPHTTDNSYINWICGSEFQPGCAFPLQCWKGVEGRCLADWCRFLLVINWIPPKSHRATPSVTQGLSELIKWKHRT